MKKGDDVICINPIYVLIDGSSYIFPLTIEKYYTIQKVNIETIAILNDNNDLMDYRKNRFITKSELVQRKRDNKLDELGI